MATPTQKSPEMEAFIKSFFGFDRKKMIKKDVCAPPPMGCGKPVIGFRDEISRKKYKISSLCQECQDKVFDK